jgi:hypothetical protein
MNQAMFYCTLVVKSGENCIACEGDMHRTVNFSSSRSIPDLSHFWRKNFLFSLHEGSRTLDEGKTKLNWSDEQ